MSKFYVQCGPIQIILLADSADQAAMSAMDRALQPHLWIYDDPGLSQQDCRDHMMLEALLHLDSTIRVSEQGFDRDDAQSFGTPDVIDQWHRLMIGMRRLFVVAGLAERTISEVAGISPARPGDAMRRLPR